MIKAEEQAFIRAALQKKLIHREDLEEAVLIKREHKSKDSILKILVRIGALDVKKARQLQAELQIRPTRKRQKNKAANLERIGPYRIEKFLGQGAMGAVYVAVHSDLKRMVALKVLLAEQPSKRAIDRFKREARLTARLNHPNIVRVYDAGEADGRHYLAMDLVEGQSLDEALTLGEVDIERSAYLVQKISEAIHYAHEQGVIHRDIKPSNILLDKSGEPLVTDFGLAVLEDRDSVRLTKTGAAVGTPAYMAPEQVLGDADRVGGHTDVYGVGATYYEILTGRPPFTGQTFLELANNICQQEPKPIRDFNPEVPEALEIICLKALEKDLDMRYRTGAEMARDLAAFLHKEPIVATRPTLVQRTRKWIRRNQGLALAIVATFIVAIAGAAFYYTLPGHLVIDTIPSNAVIVVGDKRIHTPADIPDYPAGTYNVRFDFPGYEKKIPGIETLNVYRGSKNSYVFRLFATTGQLYVESEPPGAKVRIFQGDSYLEKYDGFTNYVQTLTAGTYTLKLTAPGYLEKTVANVEIKKGDYLTEFRGEKKIKLEPDRGYLTLRSDPPDVSVSLGAKGLASKSLLVPFSEMRLGTGEYTYVARKSGYIPDSGTFQVTKRNLTQRRLALSPLATFTRSLSGVLVDEPFIADVDGDGLNDVVALAQAADGKLNEIYVFNRLGQGQKLWSHKNRGERILGCVDINHDSILDVIYGGKLEIECRSGRDGYRLWKANYSGTTAHFHESSRGTKPVIFAFDSGGRFVKIDVMTGATFSYNSVISGAPTFPVVVLDQESVDPRVAVSYHDPQLKRHQLAVINTANGQITLQNVGSKVVAAAPIIVPGRVNLHIAVLRDSGEVELYPVTRGKPPLKVGDPERGPSNFDGLEVNRITGRGSHDLILRSRGRIHVFSVENLKKPVWSQDGRLAVSRSAETRREFGQLWIDGRLYEGSSGKLLGGASAESWFSSYHPPRLISDFDNDGSLDVVGRSRTGRGFVKLETSSSPLKYHIDLNRPSQLVFTVDQTQGAGIVGTREVVSIGKNGLVPSQYLAPSDVTSVDFIEDLNGDGFRDLVIATTRSVLAVDWYSGKLLWKNDEPAGVVIGLNHDIDQDGKKDIFASQPDRFISGASGSFLQAFKASSRFQSSKSVIIEAPLSYEVDSDQYLVTSGAKGIQCLSVKKQTKVWEAETVKPIQLLYIPAKSGSSDAYVVIVEPTLVTVLDAARGRVVKQKGRRRANESGPVIVGATVCETDGRFSLIIARSNGKLSSFNPTMSKLNWTCPLPVAEQTTKPVSKPVTYIRNDRHTIAILCASGELVLIDARSARLTWSYRLFDPQQIDNLPEQLLLSTTKESKFQGSLVVSKVEGNLLVLQPPVRKSSMGLSSSARFKLAALRERIRISRSKDEFNIVVTELKALAGTDKLGISVQSTLGQAYLKQEQYEDAVRYAQRVFDKTVAMSSGRSRELAGPNIESSFVLVKGLVALGKFKEAAVVIDTLRRVNRSAAGDLAEVAGETALAKQNSSQAAKSAFEYFSRALEASPRSSRAQRGRAHSLIRMGQLKDVDGLVLDLKLALLDFPGDVESRLALGFIYISKGDAARAIRALSIPRSFAKEITAEQASARKTLLKITAYMKQNNFRSAAIVVTSLARFGTAQGWGELLRVTRDNLSQMAKKG